MDQASAEPVPTEAGGHAQAKTVLGTFAETKGTRHAGTTPRILKKMFRLNGLTSSVELTPRYDCLIFFGNRLPLIFL